MKFLYKILVKRKGEANKEYASITENLPFGYMEGLLMF